MRLSRVLYYLPAANCQSRTHKIEKNVISEFSSTAPTRTIGTAFSSRLAEGERI
jgi:hypothetical protein